jgi:hypothetical protein
MDCGRRVIPVAIVSGIKKVWLNALIKGGAEALLGSELIGEGVKA